MPLIRKNYYKNTDGYIIINGHICVQADDIDVETTIECYSQNCDDTFFDYSSNSFLPTFPCLEGSSLHDKDSEIVKESKGTMSLTTEQLSDEGVRPFGLTDSASTRTDYKPRNVVVLKKEDILKKDIKNVKENKSLLKGEKLLTNFHRTIDYIMTFDITNPFAEYELAIIQSAIRTKQLEYETYQKVNKLQQKLKILIRPTTTMSKQAKGKIKTLLSLLKTLHEMGIIEKVCYVPTLETYLKLHDCFEERSKSISKCLAKLPNMGIIKNNATFSNCIADYFRKRKYEICQPRIILDDFYASKKKRI